jgi:hypothetical protein
LAHPSALQVHLRTHCRRNLTAARSVTSLASEVKDEKSRNGNYFEGAILYVRKRYIMYV